MRYAKLGIDRKNRRRKPTVLTLARPLYSASAAEELTEQRPDGAAVEVEAEHSVDLLIDICLARTTVL